MQRHFIIFYVYYYCCSVLVSKRKGKSGFKNTEYIPCAFSATHITNSLFVLIRTAAMVWSVHCCKFYFRSSLSCVNMNSGRGTSGQSECVSVWVCEWVCEWVKGETIDGEGRKLIRKRKELSMESCEDTKWVELSVENCTNGSHEK